MLITYALIIAISLILLVFAGPIILRSGMMKSFRAGFSSTFIFGFLKKVGFSFLLWMMALTFFATIGSFVGMLALYVGSIAVSTISMYAMFHMLFQHYDLYLERGGQPLEFHPEVLKNATASPPLPQTTSQSEDV